MIGCRFSTNYFQDELSKEDRAYCGIVANMSLSRIMPLRQWPGTVRSAAYVSSDSCRFSMSSASASSRTLELLGFKIPCATCGAPMTWKEARDPCIGLLVLVMVLFLDNPNVHSFYRSTLLQVVRLAAAILLLFTTFAWIMNNATTDLAAWLALPLFGADIKTSWLPEDLS